MTLHDVSFAYATGGTVLDRLSLTVREGSITGVVGPSGCGKTTLLSILAGLLQPTSGTLMWAEHRGDVGRHPLTMMFQKDTLLPWLTVEQNIGLHFRLTRRRPPREERKAWVAELIALAGLRGAEKKYPYQLSGGMRRRVAFLAAVAPRPRVLLLDEPFSSLDEPTRVAIHQDIFEIVKRYGIGVALVTHDLAEAISLSDEVLILSARPASIVDAQHIAFGDERNVMELREDERFLHLYGVLWHELNAQIARSESADEAAR